MLSTRSLNIGNVLVMLFLMVLSMRIGVADFSWTTVWSNPKELTVFLDSRVPRTFAIVLTGMTLAVSGMVLQIVLKNRFIEPGMIGATQSAALGVLTATLFMPSFSLIMKMGWATFTTLVGMGIFLMMLRKIPPHWRLMVPLISIIYGNIIDAVTTFIAYENDALQILSVWFSGDFSGVVTGRYELLWITLSLAVVVYIMADQLTIAGMGKDLTTSLGLNYDRLVWISLIIVSVISAIVVVTIGQIPFIGLVVPNIVSRLAGDRLRRNLPVVSLMGANLLLLCDILSRVINRPYEIPVSTIFGVLGTLVFLYLLFKRRPVNA